MGPWGERRAACLLDGQLDDEPLTTPLRHATARHRQMRTLAAALAGAAAALCVLAVTGLSSAPGGAGGTAHSSRSGASLSRPGATSARSQVRLAWARGAHSARHAHRMIRLRTAAGHRHRTKPRSATHTHSASVEASSQPQAGAVQPAVASSPPTSAGSESSASQASQPPADQSSQSPANHTQSGARQPAFGEFGTLGPGTSPDS